MRLIKYSIFLLSLVSLTSCLKSKNDWGGTREDKGTIVISVTEKQYINADAQNIGFGYTNSYANFSFTAPAGNEDVRFFTVHISQPRETKLSGNLTLRVNMSPLTGFTMPPIGAITVPASYTVPASSASAFDYPVRFTVNKSLLNANNHYGATFSISSPNQGIVSTLDSTIDVVFNYDVPYNTSRYTGRYVVAETLSDPARQYTVNNVKPIVLLENATNRIDLYDWYAYTLSNGAATSLNYIFANNITTGANTALFAPRFTLDATGKVTAIQNASNTAAVTNLAVDAAAPNQFTYTSNDNRSFTFKYSFTLTTTINGVVTPRTVTVTDSYTYDATQIFY
jgi:hypothetical protein